MRNLFVLLESHNFQDSVLGVFDHTLDSNKELHEYYGRYIETEHRDVRDSGIEWIKKIIWDHEEVILTLCEFELNEI